MVYFENDPLQSVYEDLAAAKTPTHFDAILQLKGIAQEGFYSASQMFYGKKMPSHQLKMKGLIQCQI